MEERTNTEIHNLERTTIEHLLRTIRDFSLEKNLDGGAVKKSDEIRGSTKVKKNTAAKAQRQLGMYLLPVLSCSSISDFPGAVSDVLPRRLAKVLSS